MKNIKRIMIGMLLSAILTTGMSGTVARAKSYDQYLYYNDSRNKVESCDWRFPKYRYREYTATPFTNTTSACTLIQPGYGTTLLQPSYVCMFDVIHPKQSNATGDYSHLVTKLSTNFHPASTMGNLHD